MAVNDVAGERCSMFEIFFVNLWVIILCQISANAFLTYLRPAKQNVFPVKIHSIDDWGYDPLSGYASGSRTLQEALQRVRHCKNCNYMWNKTLHVDEVEVVDSADSSTSLCLYILQNYATYSR